MINGIVTRNPNKNSTISPSRNWYAAKYMLDNSNASKLIVMMTTFTLWANFVGLSLSFEIVQMPQKMAIFRFNCKICIFNVKMRSALAGLFCAQNSTVNWFEFYSPSQFILDWFGIWYLPSHQFTAPKYRNYFISLKCKRENRFLRRLAARRHSNSTPINNNKTTDMEVCTVYCVLCALDWAFIDFPLFHIL